MPAAATTAPPIPDYDELNVRKIMGQLHTLDRFGLLRRGVPAQHLNDELVQRFRSFHSVAPPSWETRSESASDTIGSAAGSSALD